MLRKTSAGTYERQDSEGNWQPVSAAEALAASSGAVAPEPVADEAGVATMIDSLVDELHADQNGAPTVEEIVEVAQVSQQIDPETPTLQSDVEVGLSEAEKLAAHEQFAGRIGEPEPPATVDVEPAPGGDFDLEVPGLVSTDSARSQKGFQTVKERLKANARKRREPRKVEVGASAAQVVGPAKGEGTAVRQSRRARERLEAGKTAGVGDSTGLRQRYVSRPAPALLGSRPRWVQDLFEAHFRSEHTLGMRREFNRMKISRTDYAIGWLTAFDKFREESSLLRLKSE